MQRAATPLAASHPFVYSTGSIERNAHTGWPAVLSHARGVADEGAPVMKLNLCSRERTLPASATWPGKSDRS